MAAEEHHRALNAQDDADGASTPLPSNRRAYDVEERHLGSAGGLLELPDGGIELELSEESDQILQRQRAEMLETDNAFREDYRKLRQKLGVEGDRIAVELPDTPTPIGPSLAGPDEPFDPFGSSWDGVTKMRMDPELEGVVMTMERLGYGFTKQGVDLMHGLSKLATTPEEVAEGIVNLDIQEIGKAIKGSYEKDPVEFIGRAGFEVFLFFGPKTRFGKVGGQFDEAAKVIPKQVKRMEKAVARGESLTSQTAELSGKLTGTGMKADHAAKVAKMARDYAIDRQVAKRLAEDQTRAARLLSREHALATAQAAAAKAGLGAEESARFAEAMVGKKGLWDWIFNNSSPRHWTPQSAREHMMKNAGASATELRALTTADLARIYPEGGMIPESFVRLGQIEGFGAFARAHPQRARILADGVDTFPRTAGDTWNRVTRSASRAFDEPSRAVARENAFLAATRSVEQQLPRAAALGDDVPYQVLTRGPASPSSVPEVSLRPGIELDHNGAFHQLGVRAVPDRWVDTRVPSYRWMNPQQLLAGPGGRPLQTMDGVMVFSGHGGRGGFQGLSTQQAARMAAEQIAAAEGRGSRITKCVLDACHQRDRRWFASSGSNAQEFARALDSQLRAAGITHEVQVLASDIGGPIYGPTVKPWFGPERPARFTPASDGARLHVTSGELGDLGLGATGAAGLAGAGYITYRIVKHLDDEEEED